AGRDDLEVRVPDPRHVPAVGGAVVEGTEQVELGALERERAQDLVCPGRVLDQEDREFGVTDRERLGAAEGGPHPLEAGDDRLQPDSELEAQCGGAERVVDVVEAGEGEGDGRLTGWGAQEEARRTRPIELDPLGGDAWRRSLLAAVRAARAAQVAEIDRFVAVGASAPATVL